MRLPAGPWLGLILTLFAWEAEAGEIPALYSLDADGPFEALSLSIQRQFPAQPARDMTLGFSDELLLLSPQGDLSVITARDSLPRGFLGADLAPDYWPESLSSDGTDWLLLSGGGASVLRLGRRGEGKEEIPLPEDAFWRQIRSDRAGRIWVSESSGDRFLVLSRSGQVLQDWRLSALIPGYRGPLRAWCNDGSGGILLAEGWPARLWRLNGAGNPGGGGSRELPAGSLALAVDSRGNVILAVGAEGEELHLFSRGMSRELVLKIRDRIWILEPGDPESRNSR